MMMMMTVTNTYKAATVLVPAALVLVVVSTHHPHNNLIQFIPFVPQISYGIHSNSIHLYRKWYTSNNTP